MNTNTKEAIAITRQLVADGGEFRSWYDVTSALLDVLCANPTPGMRGIDWTMVEREAARLLHLRDCAAAGIDPRVGAIRQDKIVGRHTCSMIDECYSDLDLEADLDSNNIKGVKAAVTWARRQHRLYEDRYNDIRSTAF